MEYPSLLRLIVILSSLKFNTNHMADKAAQVHSEVKQKLEQSNAKYKSDADKHRRFKSFDIGDLVMVHLRRERFPVGTYNKTKMKKYERKIMFKQISGEEIIIVPT
ncbi:hypothetical protein ACOSP7_004760 [Xanthoceras sorbifolium]